MHSRQIHKTKINLITLGCSKNVFDSEVLFRQLKANKFNVIHDSEGFDAPVVIINTCGFINDAKQESVNTILKWAEAKKKGSIDKLIVTGCLSERYKNELEKEIDDADEYFGTHDLSKLLKSLNADYKHNLLGERNLITPTHYAYLKISEGCDRPCSFCAIPLMRGKHVSFSMKSITEQAKQLAQNGVKELILVAQDSTYYGMDLYSKRKLAELLKRLCDVEGIEWIRLHYAYPSGFPNDVLKVMAEEKKICRYIDIPLQHISNRILSSMKRGTTKSRTNDLIKKIRDTIPGVAIRTAFIIGYPGETEKEFNELYTWINEIRFDRLGVFLYSHEEDTAAFKLKDSVPERIKRNRADILMKLQKMISKQINKNNIGSNMRVIIDTADGKNLLGRTEFDSPEVDNLVYVKSGDESVKPGDFVNVRITSAASYDLKGQIQ